MLARSAADGLITLVIESNKRGAARQLISLLCLKSNVPLKDYHDLLVLVLSCMYCFFNDFCKRKINKYSQIISNFVDASTYQAETWW